MAQKSVVIPASIQLQTDDVISQYKKMIGKMSSVDNLKDNFDELAQKQKKIVDNIEKVKDPMAKAFNIQELKIYSGLMNDILAQVKKIDKTKVSDFVLPKIEFDGKEVTNSLKDIDNYLKVIMNDISNVGKGLSKDSFFNSLTKMGSDTVKKYFKERVEVVEESLKREEKITKSSIEGLLDTYRNYEVIKKKLSSNYKIKPIKDLIDPELLGKIASDIDIDKMWESRINNTAMKQALSGIELQLQSAARGLNVTIDDSNLTNVGDYALKIDEAKTKLIELVGVLKKYNPNIKTIFMSNLKEDDYESYYRVLYEIRSVYADIIDMSKVIYDDKVAINKILPSAEIGVTYDQLDILYKDSRSADNQEHLLEFQGKIFDSLNEATRIAVENTDNKTVEELKEMLITINQVINDLHILASSSNNVKPVSEIVEEYSDILGDSDKLTLEEIIKQRDKIIKKLKEEKDGLQGIEEQANKTYSYILQAEEIRAGRFKGFTGGTPSMSNGDSSDVSSEKSDELYSKIDNLEEKNSELEERNSKLEERNSKLEERNSELEKNIASNVDNTDKTEDYNNILNQINELQNQINNIHNNDSINSQETLTKLSNDINKLHEDITNITNTINSTDISVIKEQVDNLTSAIEKLGGIDNISTIQDQFKSLNDTIVKINQDLSDMQNKLENLPKSNNNNVNSIPVVQEETNKQDEKLEYYEKITNLAEQYNKIESKHYNSPDEKILYKERISRLEEMKSIMEEINNIISTQELDSNKLEQIKISDHDTKISLQDKDNLPSGYDERIKSIKQQQNEAVKNLKLQVNENKKKIGEITKKKAISDDERNIIAQTLEDLELIIQFLNNNNDKDGISTYTNDLNEYINKIKSSLITKTTSAPKKAATQTVKKNDETINYLKKELEKKAKKNPEPEKVPINIEGSNISGFATNSQKEIDAIKAINTEVKALTKSINSKTAAIKEEAATMDNAAISEVEAVEKIKNAVTELEAKINKLPKIKLVGENDSEFNLSLDVSTDDLKNIRNKIIAEINTPTIELNNIKVGKTTPLVSSITEAIQDALESSKLTIKSENIKLTDALKIEAIQLGEEFTSSLRKEINNAIKSSAIKSVNVKFDMPEKDIFTPKMEQLQLLVQQFGELKTNIKLYQDAINTISKDLPAILTSNTQAIKAINDDCNKTLRTIDNISQKLGGSVSKIVQKRNDSTNQIANGQIKKLETLRNNLITGDAGISNTQDIKTVVVMIDDLIEKWQTVQKSKSKININDSIAYTEERKEIEEIVKLFPKYEAGKESINQTITALNKLSNTNIDNQTITDELTSIIDVLNVLVSQDFKVNSGTDSIEVWLSDVEKALKRADSVATSISQNNSFSEAMSEAGRTNRNNAQKIATDYINQYNQIISEFRLTKNYDKDFDNYFDEAYKSLLTKIDTLHKSKEFNAELDREISVGIKELKKDIANFTGFNIDGVSDWFDGVDKVIENTNKEINNRGHSADGLKQDLNKLQYDAQNLHEEFNKINRGNITPQDLLSFIQRMDDLNSKIDNVRLNLKNVKFDDNLSASTKNVDAKFSDLLFKIDQFRKLNSKIGTDSGLNNQFDELVRNINISEHTTTAWRDYSKQFAQLKNIVTSKGLTGRSIADEISYLAEKIGLKAIMGGGIYEILNYFKQMISIVKELDTSMTNLKRVSEETNNTYIEFLDTASKKAKKLGTTMKDVIDATTEFSRLGYNLEEASALADNAIIYQNVGEVDIQTATADMISALKAFDLAASDSEHVVDIFNKLGNEFAVSSSQIGSGLNESASALATANNSLEESAAMLTAITEITQDAASAGNALKTLSLRLRSTKAELTEMGEESEGAFDTVAKMQEHIKGITGFDILNEKGDYKSTYEIMKGIANVYDELGDTEQASLLESLAGKTRANQVAALLNNFKTAEKALDASLNSMGTAVKENAIYLDSIEGRLASLKSTAQSTSQNLIDTQAIKTVVSLVDGLLQLAEAVITVDENIVQLGTKKFDEDTALNTTKYFESWGKFPSIIGAVTLALSALNKQLGRIMPLIPVME